MSQHRRPHWSGGPGALAWAFVIVVMAVTTMARRVDAQAEAPRAVPATPETAAPFLGDWTVAANGNYGPATFAITIKVDAGKVVGEISSAQAGKSAITDIVKAGASLVLRYVMDYQGNGVNVVISLTPGEKQVDAALDFADGAAQMTGTAVKKVG